MAAGNHPTFSLLLAFAIAAVLLLAGPSEAKKHKAINQWCQTSDYRGLCSKMVMGATTQEEAIAKTIQTILGATTRLGLKRDDVEKAVAFLPPVSKESVVSTCWEAYDRGLENLNQALKYLKLNDQPTVKDRLSTGKELFGACAGAVKEMGGNAASLAKTSRVLDVYLGIAMAVATQT